MGNDTVLSDIWLFSFGTFIFFLLYYEDNFKWRRLSDNCLPGKRYAHSCVPIGNSFLLFGGCSNSNTFHSDFFVDPPPSVLNRANSVPFSAHTSSTPRISSQIPFAYITDEDGPLSPITPRGSSRRASNALISQNITGTWISPRVCGTIPTSRCRMAMTCVPWKNGIFCFGGVKGHDKYSDIFWIDSIGGIFIIL